MTDDDRGQLDVGPPMWVRLLPVAVVITILLLNEFGLVPW